MWSWMPSTSVSRVGRRAGMLVGEERAHEAPAEVGEREALGIVGVALVVAGAPTDEVDQGVVGVAPVDGERGDARAGDHREREEALADDLAERLEAADSFADALEPAVRAHGVEREDLAYRHMRDLQDLTAFGCCIALPCAFLGFRHLRPSAGIPGGRRNLRSEPDRGARGSAGACPCGRGQSRTWRDPAASNRRRPAVISSAVFHERFLRRVKPELRPELVDVGVDRDEEHVGRDVPQSEVDAVGGANHPAQIEQKPLATARAVGIREDVGRSPAPALRLRESPPASRMARANDRERRPQLPFAAPDPRQSAGRAIPSTRCTRRAPMRRRARSSPR